MVKRQKVEKGVLECAVCLSEFEDNEELHLLPRCSHVLHLDCIDAWLASHVICPIYHANFVEQAVNNNLNLLATPTIDATSLRPETTTPLLDHVTIVMDLQWCR